jgi:hypothetical protein
MSTHEKWLTSSYSGNANDCVEVAMSTKGTKIRDTKDRAGGHIPLSSESFEGLANTISATPKS